MKTVGLLLIAILLQGPPVYVREGDRVQALFYGYRDRLTRYFENLKATIEREASAEEAAMLYRKLESAPPAVGIYGYQLLPKIANLPQPATPIRTFSYSWPVTEGYIKAENVRLENATLDLARARVAPRGEKLESLTKLVDQYAELVRNQKAVDQHIEYNRVWQQYIAESRPRFDKLTQLYSLLKSGNAETAATIREALGKPDVPLFIRVKRQGTSHVVLQVRLYTDIADDGYLSQVKNVLEDAWKAEEAGMRYAVEIEFRKLLPGDLYRGRKVPQPGDHLDLDSHVGRFPADGGVLTTGAQFTYGAIGHYVALGPGDLTPRTLAHEFGHILGFDDGYIRGYKDLGEKGFEILELTAFFDDIMSAPREGHVQPTHFKLLMEALR